MRFELSASCCRSGGRSNAGSNSQHLKGGCAALRDRVTAGRSWRHLVTPGVACAAAASPASACNMFVLTAASVLAIVVASVGRTSIGGARTAQIW